MKLTHEEKLAKIRQGNKEKGLGVEKVKKERKTDRLRLTLASKVERKYTVINKRQYPKKWGRLLASGVDEMVLDGVMFRGVGIDGRCGVGRLERIVKSRRLMVLKDCKWSEEGRRKEEDLRLESLTSLGIVGGEVVFGSDRELEEGELGRVKGRVKREEMDMGELVRLGRRMREKMSVEGVSSEGMKG